MRINITNTFFVFDLDDTLYREIDYCHSGFIYVSSLINKMYGADVYKKLIKLFYAGEKDVFGKICLDLGLPIEIKESLVWSYRTHFPSIRLLPYAMDVIEEARSKSAGVCILSDGRSLTQRIKMNALHIGHIRSYISEEHGEEKPGLKRYKLIQDQHPGKKYVYIADNPNKDFIGPNILGWFSIGIKGGSWNIHPQDINKEKTEFQPSVWINCIKDLRKFLC